MRITIAEGITWRERYHWHDPDLDCESFTVTFKSMSSGVSLLCPPRQWVLIQAWKPDSLVVRERDVHTYSLCVICTARKVLYRNTCSAIPDAQPGSRIIE